VVKRYLIHSEGAFMKLKAYAAGVTTVVVGLVAGILVSGQSDGDVLRACADQKGTLRLLTAGSECGTRERLVTWNVVGPVGPQGPMGPASPAGPTGAAGEAGPKGDPGLGSVRAVDANGLDVGEAAGAPDSDRASIVRNIDGILVSFTLRRDGILPKFEYQELFLTPDCSGASYMRIAERPFIREATLSHDGYLIYAVEQTVFANAYSLAAPGDCRPFMIFPSFPNIPMGPAVKVPWEFTAPFSLQ
jgi:hypothetical protein